MTYAMGYFLGFVVKYAIWIVAVETWVYHTGLCA